MRHAPPPIRKACRDFISASDSHPASVKLNDTRRKHMFNVIMRRIRVFDCSQMVTILFNILTSHVLLFITACIQMIGYYYYYFYYYYYYYYYYCHYYSKRR